MKQSLSQRGVKSNVLVNVETQNYELVRDEKGNQFNLLRSISAQQLLNAAGRDFVLQRTVQFSDYVINSPQFSAALAAEHSSERSRCSATQIRLAVRCERKTASAF